MKNISFLFCFLLVTISITTAQVSLETSEQQAIKATNEWLVLVDSGNYDKSWDTSASILQNAISKENWNITLTNILSPFGSLISRKVISSKYLTSIPGAPDGEYVIIKYKTKFENKENTIETVTPLKSQNGKWKVSGYYIK